MRAVKAQMQTRIAQLEAELQQLIATLRLRVLILLKNCIAAIMFPPPPGCRGQRTDPASSSTGALMFCLIFYFVPFFKDGPALDFNRLKQDNIALIREVCFPHFYVNTIPISIYRSSEVPKKFAFLYA